MSTLSIIIIIIIKPVNKVHTVAENLDRRFLRQSHFRATVSLLCDSTVILFYDSLTFLRQCGQGFILDLMVFVLIFKGAARPQKLDAQIIVKIIGLSIIAIINNMYTLYTIGLLTPQNDHNGQAVSKPTTADGSRPWHAELENWFEKKRKNLIR